MRYLKAIAAAVLSGLAALGTGLASNPPGEPVGLTLVEIIIALAAVVGGGGATALAKNAGFLDLAKLGVTEDDVRRALAASRVTGS